MIALPEIEVHNKIYESSSSLVHQGVRGDRLVVVIKILKQDYPSSQELTRYTIAARGSDIVNTVF
jgi:hypothetical protein